MLLLVFYFYIFRYLFFIDWKTTTMSTMTVNLLWPHRTNFPPPSGSAQHTNTEINFKVLLDYIFRFYEFLLPSTRFIDHIIFVFTLFVKQKLTFAFHFMCVHIFVLDWRNCRKYNIFSDYFLIKSFRKNLVLFLVVISFLYTEICCM